MIDPMVAAGAIGALKPTFDALRSALGLLKDAKDLLPAGDKSAAISQALATAEASAKLAEAEIAKALGFELCKCEFPPTAMLTVGTHSGRAGGMMGAVYECPRCKFNTASPYSFARLPGK
jgi:hypothetical protein